MKTLIVLTPDQITAFNTAITPLMLAAGQIMERLVDADQCPVNSVTGEYAIPTDATGLRREVIEKYLADNGLTEVELDEADEDWFPKQEFTLN